MRNQNALPRRCCPCVTDTCSCSGDEVQWELPDRGELHLARLQPPPPPTSAERLNINPAEAL
jgi:hypothetical protein